MEEHNCPICGGEPVVMGQLGNRVHCRCRNCGADFSWVDLPFLSDHTEVEACDPDVVREEL
jgi:hypothetical protein